MESHEQCCLWLLDRDPCYRLHHIHQAIPNDIPQNTYAHVVGEMIAGSLGSAMLFALIAAILKARRRPQLMRILQRHPAPCIELAIQNSGVLDQLILRHFEDR